MEAVSHLTPCPRVQVVSMAVMQHTYKAAEQCYDTFELEVAVFVETRVGYILASVERLFGRSIVPTKVCHLPGRMIIAITKVSDAALCSSWQQVLRLSLLVLAILDHSSRCEAQSSVLK